MFDGGGSGNLDPKRTSQHGTGLDSNIASLLCYLCAPVTSIILLVIEKDNEDVRFHAWQATIFGFACILVMFLTWFLGAFFGILPSFISWISWIFKGLLATIEFIVMVSLWIICIIKAYQGERWRIPYIGDYAARKSGLVI